MTVPHGEGKSALGRRVCRIPAGCAVIVAALMLAPGGPVARADAAQPAARVAKPAAAKAKPRPRPKPKAARPAAAKAKPAAKPAAASAKSTQVMDFESDPVEGRRLEPGYELIQAGPRKARQPSLVTPLRPEDRVSGRE
jgi:hypothetical protein